MTPAGRLGRRRRSAGAALAVSALVALTACGTRLPDSAFGSSTSQLTSTAAAGAGNNTGAAGLPLPVGGGTSALPTAGQGTGAVPSAAAGTVLPGDVAASLAATPAPGAPALRSVGPTTTSLKSGGVKPGTKTTAKASTGTTGGSAVNTASDRGVTPTTISVCNIVTSGGTFGTSQFTPSYYGAAAYFADLNAHGGIHGRQVIFRSHPDDGSSSGDTDEVHTCIDTDNAFAFVANNIYQYGGVSYEDQMDVPDIGGQAISTAYDYYPHLYTIEGTYVPRNHQLGFGGYAYNTSEQGEFFKQRIGSTNVGVVDYDESSSQYGAAEIGGAFQAAGLTVKDYQVNLGLPNFASAVAQMQADGVDTVADALDQNGNQKLCQAIEQNTSFLAQLKAKVTTSGSWTQSYGAQFASTPGCLGKTYADSGSWNYANAAGNPEVAKFNSDISQYFPSEASQETQWMLEGYAAADWFTAAANSCGADLTRVCLEAFMNRQQPYTADGILNPLTSFNVRPPSYYAQPTNQCVSVAQWSIKANTWVDVGEQTRDCFNAPGYKLQLQQPS